MRLPHITFGKVLVGTGVVLLLATGTTYAANTIGSGDIINNSIKSIDVKNNAITGKDVKAESLKAGDIRTGAVTSSEILDATITTDDVLDNTLTADDLAANSVGPDEIQTDAVQASEVADNSIGGGEIVNGSVASADIAAGGVRGSDLGTITQRSATSANIPGGGNGSVTANCLAGEVVLSGGSDGFFDVFVVASRRQGNGWAVFAHNDSGGNRTITAHAYCLAS